MTNEANTVWKPTIPSEGEYTSGTTNNIVDPQSVNLVDPSAIQVVDTGVTFTKIPSTVWTNSPGN